MKKRPDITGKTFDQQLELVGEEITQLDIAPNRRVPGELVFEPMGNGVRVTARDESHRVLWGFVGTKETVQQVHCLVAVYETLGRLITEELKRHHMAAPEDEDSIAQARQNISALKVSLRRMEDLLDVKKANAASLKRATTIARATSEALRQIALDTANLGGKKVQADPPLAIDEV